MGKIIKNGIEYGGGGGGSGTGGHVIVDTDGSPVADEPKLQFTGLDVQDNSTDSETEVAAFGLNTDSLDDIITSANVPASPMVTNGLGYSTTEQIVGRWIDGSVLYQKTYEITKAANATNPTASLNIANFKMAVDVDAVYVNNDLTATHPMPGNWVDTTGASTINQSQVIVTATQINIRIKTGELDAAGKIYVTIKYVKTS